METQKKRLDLKVVEEGDRTFRAIITTPAVDREGEVLLPQGMIATDFEANPVVFYVHEYGTLPIARCLKLERKPNSWEAVAKIADRPDAHEGEWMPDAIYSLIKQGILNGVSVGFIPVETRKPTVDDQKKFGPDVRSVVSKWKLLEYSVTGMPCNQEALITAVKSFTPATRAALGITDKSNEPDDEKAVTPADETSVTNNAETNPVDPPPALIVIGAEPVDVEPVRKTVVLLVTTRSPVTEAQKKRLLRRGVLWA